MGSRGTILRALPSGNKVISKEDDPFWAACQDLGVPVTIHGWAKERNNRAGGRSADLPRTGAGPRGTPIGTGGAGLAGDAMSFSRDLILLGVLDRFPKLRIGLIEVMAGWVPYHLESMDDSYFRHRAEQNIQIKYLPSEYWRRNFYVTFIGDQYGIKNRHEIGVETMQWSSDYPHVRNDWTYSRKVIQTTFAGVPEEEKQMMIAGNCAREYGLS